jgi:hypothetical protein
MKKNYLKIIVLIFGLVITVANTKSQIVYTDVDPDVTVSEFLQGYGVDFNDDDKIDVHITLLDNVGVWVMHLIPDANLDQTYVVYDGEEASVLIDGDDISPASNLYQLGTGWGGLLYGYWESSGEYGNWTGVQEDKYLGIKFEIDGNFHFGWIKLTTIIYAYDNMEFTVKAYAYNTIANEGILAGDTGLETKIEKEENNSFSIYPNPAKNIINLPAFDEAVDVSICDISGKIVYRDEIQARVIKRIDVSALNPGLYIVHAQTGGKVHTFKLVKE